MAMTLAAFLEAIKDFSVNPAGNEKVILSVNENMYSPTFAARAFDFWEGDDEASMFVEIVTDPYDCGSWDDLDEEEFTRVYAEIERTLRYRAHRCSMKEPFYVVVQLMDNYINFKPNNYREKIFQIDVAQDRNFPKYTKPYVR